MINQAQTRHFCLPDNVDLHAWMENLQSLLLKLESPSFLRIAMDGVPAESFAPRRYGAHMLVEDPIQQISAWLASTISHWLDHCKHDWTQGDKLNYCSVLLGMVAMAFDKFGSTWPLHATILPTEHTRAQQYCFLLGRTADRAALQRLTIALPVYTSDHWSLLFLKNRQAYLIDSLQISDSMRDAAEKVLSKLQQDFDLDPIEPLVHITAPQLQNNTWECGYRVVHHYGAALRSSGPVRATDLLLPQDWLQALRVKHQASLSYLLQATGKTVPRPEILRVD